MPNPPDDDIETVSVDLPLDRATASWIEEVAAEAGADPAVIIASILHDIRVDDEENENVPIGYRLN